MYIEMNILLILSIAFVMALAVRLAIPFIIEAQLAKRRAAFNAHTARVNDERLNGA
jgi:hypothetical protein